jgi:hypothetical protein
MKRRQLNRRPGIGDFKNKCSDEIKNYDPTIIRIIYETVYENIYCNGSFAQSVKKETIKEIEILLKKQKISVLYLEKIVIEILDYFKKFLILLDSSKIRQS